MLRFELVKEIKRNIDIKSIRNGDKVDLVAWTINFAAKNGHLEVVKWLYTKGLKGTYLAVDWAAKNGYLDIVKFLYTKDLKGTENTIDYAAGNGYLEVVQWLYTKGIKGTSWAVDWAAANGYLDIVKWLKENGTFMTFRYWQKLNFFVLLVLYYCLSSIVYRLLTIVY